MGDRQWFDTADIRRVRDLLAGAGAEAIWVKTLGSTNNSKQQVWLGNDPADLSFLPLGEPSYTPAKSRKRKAGAPVVQIPVPWRWVTPDGVFDAPNAKLCYYPQYPEVRLSGFLQGCAHAPTELMNASRRGHELGRCLFLGRAGGHVVGLVTGAPAPASRYVPDMATYEEGHVCPVEYGGDRTVGEVSVLERALAGIIGRRITPWRMLADGRTVRPYVAPNAPGLTLEAELGVGENAIPGPDFDVWELKAIRQRSLDRLGNHKVTLFTPQPDLGWTTRHPQAEFVLRYGHVSHVGDDGPDEYYLTSGDINRPGEDKDGARLDIGLTGFTDARHFDPDGMIALTDRRTGGLAAGWSYLKLLTHWQRKHNRAAYVPYVRSGTGDGATVEFGPLVTLGISTGFGLFLQAFHDGKVVYDPGDKITLRDGGWTPHARSQFRIDLKDIGAIYHEVRRIDVRDLSCAAVPA